MMRDEYEIEEILMGLAEKHESYLHGDCCVFALALARVSGRSLGAVFERSPFAGEEVQDEGLVHDFVYHGSVSEGGEDAIVDLMGYRTVASVLDEFPHEGLVWSGPATQEVLLQLNEGTSILSSEIEARVAAAVPLARQVWELACAQITHAQARPKSVEAGAACFPDIGC